jgi:Cft2 family RNA processing exonuclease
VLKIDRGIKCGDHFSVDPTIKSKLAIISHAHSDHLKAHETIVATAPTVELAGLKYKRFEARVVDYHESFELGPARIELAPAGHMLGSAQIIMDINGERIVYTGDIKIDDNRTCGKADIHACDTLLIDTTYGLPHYKFPEIGECREMLVDFVNNSLKRSITPVILAYSFGKAQEAMEILSSAGIEMDVYKKAYEAALIYKKFGVKLKNFYLLGDKPISGRAVILPPGAFRYVDSRGWGRYKTCFLSGWVLDRKRGFGKRNGFGIPLSDHASFEDIIAYIEKAKPRKVFTLFGPANIAEYLRRIGYKAEAVDLNKNRSLVNDSSSNLELFN